VQPVGAIWFGTAVAVVAALMLLQGMWRGEFVARWPFAPMDREHPDKFWLAVALHVASILFGLYCLACGLIGVQPF
jgi:hypothetical protein